MSMTRSLIASAVWVVVVANSTIRCEISMRWRPPFIAVATLAEAREIIAEFHLMIRRRAEAGLTPWIERARVSLVASFASGVEG